MKGISKLSGRLAIIFPGQGSQSVGMLNGPLASRMAERADAILGYSLSDLITSGPADTLAQTEHTQPAMVLASLCEWAHLREKYPQLTKHDHVFAGNSVGEYSAMAAAGWISFDVAIKLAVMM